MFRNGKGFVLAETVLHPLLLMFGRFIFYYSTLEINNLP